ncbi:uncharacterized protein LOC113225596 [Hyposmocoma kahamanoa]|uniref:uncharacterized protein LOC113225596 n=1 Tax=Hyposmocoma kahamanoa TaxID=1477025 RepID=UPI000E6D75C6|nr:uncharacterized protein LOC113225596 [Hyposmocoma kahamanoa]
MEKHCRCPFTANAEKLSLYIGILNFILASLSILGCITASKYNVNIISPIFSPNDQFFTPEFAEVVGRRILLFASVLTLMFSALLVLGVRRQRSCGAKAFFLHGVMTLALCIAFTALCVITAFLDSDFIRIVPHIIFIFLYIFYGLELAVVHRAFLNIDQSNIYQPLTSRSKLIDN